MKKSNFFLRFGKGFVQNIELKIVAFMFACLLWFITVNVSDPVASRTFTNVPVTVINADIITNEGKMLQILDGTESVNVIIHAPRSVRENISVEHIIATADVSQMELNTLIPITVTVPGFEGDIQSAVAHPTNLVVVIEDIERRIFPIVTNVTGQPAEGYVVGETTATPDTIEIIGPETLVNSIGRIEARVSVSGLAHSQSLAAELIIFDGYGERMNPALFPGFLEDDVTHYVNVEMLETELVPIGFREIGNIPEGYIVTNISSEPSYILVAGTRQELQRLTEIMVTPDAFDLEDEVGIHEITVDIRPYLSAGIRLADENHNLIVVSLAIERAGTRTIELPVDTISLVGLADGLTASFDTDGVGTISIVVSGQQQILDGLDLRNFVSVNLTAFTTSGTTIVPVQVELPSNVTLQRAVAVRILLEEREEGETVD